MEARSGYASNYPKLLEGLKGISTRSKIISSAIFAVKPVQSQAISNRTHFSRTPKKPDYLINSSIATYLVRGPLGFGPIQFLLDTRFTNLIFFRPFLEEKGTFPVHRLHGFLCFPGTRGSRLCLSLRLDWSTGAHPPQKQGFNSRPC